MTRTVSVVSVPAVASRPVLTLRAVPQGSKVNELRALVRKHRAELLGDNVSAKATDAFGAATSKAGNQYAKATDSATLQAEEAFNTAVSTWSESRLKAYLDARGVVSQKTCDARSQRS